MLACWYFLAAMLLRLNSEPKQRCASSIAEVIPPRHALASPRWSGPSFFIGTQGAIQIPVHETLAVCGAWSRWGLSWSSLVSGWDDLRVCTWHVG
ncbi:unnamed protein product [Effrenium voratum]|nr:unnamed protein product [Effrenium voratum]